MKKIFKVTLEWQGKTRKTIVAGNYDEAMGVIDSENYVPTDFIYEDDSLKASYIEEIKKAG